jgi:phosphoglycolate phosphatase
MSRIDAVATSSSSSDFKQQHHHKRDPIPQLTTRKQVDAFLARHDAFLVDCDGVLWLAGEAIPGAAETVQMLRRMKKQVIFVTNNSTSSREAYAEKFRKRLGLDVDPTDIVTSASATAQFLAERHPECKKAFVCGGQGVIDELALAGIESVGGPVDGDVTRFSEEDFSAARLDQDVSAVVMGWDLRFNFFKLCMASLYVQRGCRFIATNRDAFDKLTDRNIPGNGAMVAAVEASLPDHDPPTVCGKPSVELANALMSRFELDPERTCMIGDRLDTDIEFGNNAGMTSLLVLTGTTELHQLEGIERDDALRPTVVADAISRLLNRTFASTEMESEETVGSDAKRDAGAERKQGSGERSTLARRSRL